MPRDTDCSWPWQPARRRLLLGGVAAATLSACAGLPLRKTERVLFVGNSLTYFNDLPGQFAQLAGFTLSRPIDTELIARGGATLHEHLQEGVALRELANGGYSAVVLQEWGGGLNCNSRHARFGFNCPDSHRAHASLVTAARAAGTTPVLLGTPQRLTSAALGLEQAEAALARSLRCAHVGLGDFPELLARYPSWDWLDADGHHPGPDLSLLMALRLLDRLYAASPKAAVVDLELRQFRGRYAPRLSSPASAQHFVVPRVRRRLSAEQLAARLALVRASPFA